MSSPLNIQIKTTASPGPLNLSDIASAPETPVPTTELSRTTLPPASLFTFLPDLYVIISRLSDIRNLPPESSAQDSLTQTLSGDSGTSLRQISSSEGTIEIKDLPGQVFGLKRRIMEARAVIESLEDVSRTLEDQVAEMDLLKDRIDGYRKRLGELGAITEKNRMSDMTMDGVKE